MGMVYRKLLGFLICFIMIINSGIIVSAADSEAPKVVRVGFFAFDGYHIQDNDGRRSGYGYEVLQRLARYENVVYEYVGYDKSWSEMKVMLENGEIDLLTSIRKRANHEEKFDFSEEEIGTSSTILTVKAGNRDIVSGDYSTYEGLRIGLVRGSSRNDTFDDFVAEHKFQYTKAYYDSTEILVDALQDGEVDAIVTSNLRAIEDEWVLEKFGEAPFYAVVKKGNTELLQTVNDGIAKMNKDAPEWKSELFNKYYKTDMGEELYLTPQESEYLQGIQEKNYVFKVGVNPDRYPYSWFEDGQAKGILPELFAEIAGRE